MKSILYLDFETQCEAELTGKNSVGAYLYTHPPSFRAICLGWSFLNYTISCTAADTPPRIDLCKSINPELLAYALDPDVIFCAHNAYFDRWVWRMVMVPLGYPDVPLERWKCTMAKAYAHALPPSLEKCALALKLNSLKNTDEKEKCKYLFNPKPKDLWREPSTAEFWTPEERPEDYASMYRYCLDDLPPMIEIDETLMDLIPIEQKVWEMDQRINDRGIHVDLALIGKVLDLVAQQKELDMAKFFDILTGNDKTIEDAKLKKPSQRGEFKKWLARRGYALPNMQAPTVDAFMARTDLPPYIREAVEVYQSARMSSLAKYKAMLRYADADGVIREIAQYHGAHTGRFGHRGVQFGNMFRPTVDVNTVCDAIDQFGFEYFSLMYDDVAEALSSAVRGMVTPR